MHYPILVRILVKTIKKPNLSQPFLAFPTFSAFQQVDVLSQIRRKGKHNPSWEFSQKSGKKLFFAKKGEGGGTFFFLQLLYQSNVTSPHSLVIRVQQGGHKWVKNIDGINFFSEKWFFCQKSPTVKFFFDNLPRKIFFRFFWTLQNEDILEGGYLL